MATLVATRYVPPGSYIGQLITPTPSAVPDNRRIPCFIGRGSRLARGSNLPIRRSYVSDESLTFSSLEPHVAPLRYPADGDQSAARIFKDDGTEVRRDQWSFQKVNGEHREILLSPEVFDSNASYVIDYQSTDRSVKDPIPVADIRSIEAVGTGIDHPEFKEFENFFVVTNLTDPSPDGDNANPEGTAEDPVADGSNTGGGTVAQASSSVYSHGYTRAYEVAIDSTVTGVKATGDITFDTGANHVDGDTFTLNDGVNDPVTFELDSDGEVADGNVAITFDSGDSADQIASEAETVINGATLNITATANTATVDLENDAYLAAGNTTIDSDVDAGAASFGTTDFTGGTDRSVTLSWNANPLTPGNDAQPPVPLHSTISDPTLTVVSSGVNTDVAEQSLENGIVLALDFGSADAPDFDVGDTWTFKGLGPGLIEANARYDNENQFPEIDEPEGSDDNSGSGTIEVSAGAEYTGSYNSTFTLEVTAASGSSPNRTATVVWAEHGDRIGIDGTINLDESAPSTMTDVSLQNGVDLDFEFGASNFSVGDRFVVHAKAPRLLYRAKDNRSYTLTVGVATNPASGEGFVSGGYSTDTIEGGFGVWEATANDESPNDSNWESGHFELPDRVYLAARNMFLPGESTGNRHAAGDAHSMAGTNEEELDWTLRERLTETVEQDEVLTDVSGAITGSPNTKYVILRHEPDEIEAVVDGDDNPLSFTWIEDTPFIYFGDDPESSVEIRYLHRSDEPEPGQVYYLTGNHLRPDDLYNTPILVTNRQEGRDLLAPARSDNHLHIMNELAFDNNVPAAFYVQVKDGDGDGVFTDLDFKAAINASEAPNRISDVVVLSKFSALSDALASVTRMNDPFERRERLLWVGAPIGTPIGDVNTSDSLVFLAKNTLQVFGNSPAHGTRVMVGATEARKNIRLEDGSSVEVTLDGSFVAGALAAVAASFEDPGETVLRKTLNGFTHIETHGDVESPEHLRLGANQIIYFTDRGGGVYRVEEDVTVDNFAQDFKLINNMTQKQFVTKFVRKETDENLISIVVPSAEAGSALVKGFVSSALTSLVTRGLIGQYQDENQNTRPLDPDRDVVVFQDKDDPTLYHFYYAYFLRNSIKRLFGLFTVNTNDFGLRRAA